MSTPRRGAALLRLTLLTVLLRTAVTTSGEEEKTLRWAVAVENARGAAVATDVAGDIYVGGTVDGVRGTLLLFTSPRASPLFRASTWTFFFFSSSHAAVQRVKEGENPFWSR